MKTPDKIYIYRGSMGSLFAHEKKDIPYVEATEYISKDVLLEWLDANAHIVSHVERQRVFNEVIDKINTM